MESSVNIEEDLFLLCWIIQRIILTSFSCFDFIMLMMIWMRRWFHYMHSLIFICFMPYEHSSILTLIRESFFCTQPLLHAWDAHTSILSMLCTFFTADCCMLRALCPVPKIHTPPLMTWFGHSLAAWFKILWWFCPKSSRSRGSLIQQSWICSWILCCNYSLSL